MKIARNLSIPGQHKKEILLDLFYRNDGADKPIVLFCHGYKGYKDWGAWNLVAEKFARQDFLFAKMNFSHNGGTVEQPIDFPDLESFGQNNYLKELDDLESVLDWIASCGIREANTEDITLIGHSRGGGIVLLKAAEDKRIKQVISWAGVSDFASRFPTGEALEEWAKAGVAYITNARTKQKMPHYYQFYTSFKENEERLTIRKAVSSLGIPQLIIHGSGDESVLPVEAEQLHKWNPRSSLEIIPDANHTFGSSQPWQQDQLPHHLAKAVELSLHFLKNSKI